MSEQNRKILIIVENLPVPFDTRVWQEATTLAANGYEVSVICPKGKGATAEMEELEGVHIYRHDLPEANGVVGYVREYYGALKAQRELAEIVYREHGFDVIHGCNPPDDIYMVAKKFKSRGVDYVFDHHDICPELFEAKFGKKEELGLVKKMLYKSQTYLEKKTYQNAKFAFVTNESYRSIAIERGGMDPNRIIVLRSGPKLERMRIQPSDESIKRGKKYMVGYLGVIGQQEGIEYLLEAAKIIKKARNDVFWGIVGGGPHLDALRKMSSDMGLDDCVEFTGRVSDEDLLRYLNTADICVNSDEFNPMNEKSTMNKILEYMALAKPIVQFDLTEGRFSAQDASLYAEPNNPANMAEKVVKLLEDPERRKTMGEYGRNRVVNELSWGHTSQALLDGYERYFAGEFD